MTVSALESSPYIEISLPRPKVAGLTRVQLPKTATVADLKANLGAGAVVRDARCDVVSASSKLALFIDKPWSVTFDGTYTVTTVPGTGSVSLAGACCCFPERKRRFTLHLSGEMLSWGSCCSILYAREVGFNSSTLHSCRISDRLEIMWTLVEVHAWFAVESGDKAFKAFKAALGPADADAASVLPYADVVAMAKTVAAQHGITTADDGAFQAVFKSWLLLLHQEVKPLRCSVDVAIVLC